MPECRSCKAQLSESDRVCPVCGADARGSTESFAPVGGHDEPHATDTDVAESPALVVRKGPQPGERFYIERDTLSVGRDPESDIFLNDMTVSRFHATLHRGGGEISVRDEGSLNGTYVNGICVDSARLEDGDVLQIGTFQMAFIDRAAEGSSR